MKDEVRSPGVQADRPAGALLERLEPKLTAALRQARRSGDSQLVSVTTRIAGDADPSALVIGSRTGDEPWFCFEQPDRSGAAVAALGAVRSLEAAGPDRFGRISRGWQELTGRAHADPPSDVPGSGLIAVGGFAFARTGGGSPRWRGFPPACLTVPAVSLARRDGQAWLTLNLDCAPDDTADELLAHAQRRMLGLRADPLPLLDPDPSGRYEVVSAMPPAHYEQAVARGVQRIRSGELQKVVLAREVEVHAPRPHDPAAVLGILREAFQSCYVFAVGRGDATFLAASPELLIRREGQRASTVALAGSIRRSADPAVDDHLGEQLLGSAKDREENAIVARRIAKMLRPHSVWVSAAAEPGLVRVANIQHLGAPIRAQLRSPIDAVTLAGLLHPTPAVGGEPDDVALQMIPALEGMDRGWYAGPVGWTDSMGDGEFCVALRCALLRGALATCYAGAGIVRDSDPAAELAETEVKLQALLPLLAG
jgi:salicylate biosynthesis isochorismate synthase/menaquinone-specific isochorismate synthase